VNLTIQRPAAVTARRRGFPLTGVCLMAGAALLACTPPADNRRTRARAAEREGTIIVVGTSQDDPLWDVISATVRREVSLYPQYRVRAVAPRYRSSAGQARLLTDARSDDMLGLCIHPVDAEALRPLLEVLRTDGVAVVSLMVPIPSKQPFPHAGLDEYKVGETLANALHDAIPGGGTAAVLYDGGDSPQHRARFDGFNEQIARWSSVTVLKKLDCRDRTETAQKMMRDLMARYPRLDAWASMSDWPLRDRRAGERFLPKTCKLVAFGSQPDYWPQLTGGTCHALIAADFDRIVQQGVQSCISLIRNESPSISHYLSDPILLTHQSLPDYRVKWFQWRQSSETGS